MLATMGFTWRLGGVVIVALALAAGCGGSGISSGGDGGNGNGNGGGGGGGQGHAAADQLTAASFPAQLAQLACDTLEPCCSAGQLPFDRAACLQGLNDGSIDTGDGTVFDSAAAQRCLDEFKSATHGCSAFDKSQLPDCNRLTQGALALGAACTSERQCARTPGQITTCDYAQGSTTGTCSLVPEAAHAARGETCNATCFTDGNCEAGTPSAPPAGTPPPPASGDCYVADGLYCAWDSQQCQPIGNSGDTCHAPEGCSSGLVCVGLADQSTSDDGTAHPGTCGPPQPEGAPCVTSEECATFACDRGTGFCVHVPFASAGLCLGMLPGAD